MDSNVPIAIRKLISLHSVVRPPARVHNLAGSTGDVLAEREVSSPGASSNNES
jgi:hypothetical protein